MALNRDRVILSVPDLLIWKSILSLIYASFASDEASSASDGASSATDEAPSAAPPAEA